MERISENSKTIRKTKEEIKKELDVNCSLIKKLKQIEEKADKMQKCEDTTSVIWEFEDIIKSKEKNIVWLTYQQGKVLQRLNEKEKFINMVKGLRVSKSTLVFKITLLSW